MGDTGGIANGKQAYKPSKSLTIGNLCGSCAALTRVDHCRTVKGVRKASSRVIDSAAEAVKRSIRLAGSSVVATGGMKRAQLACQSGVVGKISAHQVLQRRTVRAGTASVPDSFACVDVGPARRADINTTASDKYTRRPRKRTDMAVERLRHRLQQKLNRDS